MKKKLDNQRTDSRETSGQRLARLRKERGFTQVELAEKVGTTQTVISDYERDKLRINADMAVKFALALDVSADVLLGLKPPAKSGKQPSRKILRRMEKIEQLPVHQQTILLKTIDAFLKGVQK